MDAGVHSRGAGVLIRARSVQQAGGELPAGDGGVQGDDVLGVSVIAVGALNRQNASSRWRRRARTSPHWLRLPPKMPP